MPRNRNMTLIREIETKILDAVIAGILDTTKSNIQVWGGIAFPDFIGREPQEIKDAAFAVDEALLTFKLPNGSEGKVLFIWGNGGWDAISDYTTNLDAAYPAILAEADRISDQFARAV